MNTKPSRIEREQRPNVVGVRFSDNEQERMSKSAQSLALPVAIPLSTLVHTFAMIGLQSFERTQLRKRKPRVATTQNAEERH
jgi:hypothetical protein